MASKSIRSRRWHTDYPINREVLEIVLDHSSDATTITKDINLNGTIMDVFFVVPTLDGTQCTLYFLDEDGDEYYNSDLVDENQTHHLTPGFSCAGTVTVKIVTATSQTADRTFKVKILYA